MRWGIKYLPTNTRVKGNLLFDRREGEAPEAEWNRGMPPLCPKGYGGLFLSQVFAGAIYMTKMNWVDIADAALTATALMAHEAKKLRRKGKQLLTEVRYDIEAFRQRDPAARSDLEVLLLYSGLHARLAHRASHKLYQTGHTFAARAVSQGAKALTGIEIHPGATIGRGLVIDHGSGVVIGETAEIGDNCTLYQGVTLGGTGKEEGKRHPTLGDNVMVGAGAKILGPVNIGDNAKIAAGAVVLDTIPADSTAVGIPARVVRVSGKRVANDLDQINIPDPVSQELASLRRTVTALKKDVAALRADAPAPEKKSTTRKKSVKKEEQ